MLEDLLDDIYESALVPDHWSTTLERCAALSNSFSGAILVVSEHAPPRFRATPNVVPTLEEFCETDAWSRSERQPQRLIDKLGHVGFICDVDFLSPEQLARDSCEAHFEKLGIGWQLGTMVPLPGGETIAITFERRRVEGRHPPEMIALLNGLRPELARAGLISARLGLERARGIVDTLERIGLPAVILAGSGRALAVNKSFEAMSSTFLPQAYGGVRIANAAADELFRGALARSRLRTGAAGQSFPVPAQADRSAVIVHVLPIAGAGHDIFTGATHLVVATVVGAAGIVPPPTFLHILFDLSPAEARVAIGLALGLSLKAVAAQAGIQFSTARSYLEQVFSKTGTRQQSQLVALLKSVQPITGFATHDAD